MVDANDPPNFPKGNDGSEYKIFLNVYSHAEVGEDVGSIIFAEDEDDQDMVSYVLSGGDGSISLSNRSVGNGGAVLQVNQALSVGSSLLVVNAFDNSSASDSMKINITILDSNKPPNITSDHFYAYENIAPGSSIGNVNGNDPDFDRISYSIIAGNKNSLFSIDQYSGTLKYQTNGVSGVTLDFETQSLHTLVIEGIDDATNPLSSYAIINVTILDVNEPPLLKDDDAVVVENEFSGNVSIHTLFAIDPDNDEKLQYSLEEADLNLQISTNTTHVAGALNTNKFNSSTKYHFIGTDY